MTENEEVSKAGQLPDTEKLRRFSLGVGIALLIYVFAGGEFGDSFQTILTPIIHFKRSWVLLLALILTSVYSSYRYWYYGIHLASTRAKMRKYLESSDSVYVFNDSENVFNSQANHINPTETRNFLSALYAKVPAGLARKDYICITHGSYDTDQIKQKVAKQLEQYFPQIKAANIETSIIKGQHWWAHVGSLSLQTQVLCCIEDTELYLPIIVNGVATAAWIVAWLWPQALRLIQ